MDGLSPCLFRERDAALHGGLEAAELFEDLDRALENGPLDPVEFLTDLGGGFGVAGRPGPASHDLPRPLHLPMRARGDDDLNGPALSPERVPELAVRHAPGPERGRGIVAGIGVDEDGALGVQRDRQLYREAGISLPKYLWGNDLVTPSEIRVSPSVSEGRKLSYPLGLRQKRNRSVVPWRGGR